MIIAGLHGHLIESGAHFSLMGSPVKQPLSDSRVLDTNHNLVFCIKCYDNILIVNALCIKCNFNMLVLRIVLF